MKKMIEIFTAVFLSGCVTSCGVTPDYIAPTSGPTATVIIGSESGKYVRNMSVLYHSEKCDYESSQLVGLLHSAAVGIENVDELMFEIPANQKTSLSVQAVFEDSLKITGMNYSTNTLYCRPIVDFYARDGSIYKVELLDNDGVCYYDVKMKNGDDWNVVSDAGIRQECNLPFGRGPKG